MKRKLLLSILLFLFGFFVFSQQGKGYDDKTTHPGLTDEMVDFYNVSFPQKLTAEEKEWIVQGSIDEDMPPRWINHFYDPISKEGWKAENLGAVPSATLRFFSSIFFNINTEIVSSKQWVHDEFLQTRYASYGGNNTWENAIRQYANGNKKEAYHILGHILHLLEDKTVPDHTRNDTHAHEGTILTGDGGSPYEDYGKGFTRQNLTVADELVKANKQPVSFSLIDDYFDYLARYSNGYFFSEDTINSPKYTNPKITREDGDYGYGKDRNSKEFVLVGKNESVDTETGEIVKKYTLRKEGNVVLSSYFSRLAQEAVMSGAGAIELFLKEAEKATQNKDAITPAPQVSWWQKMRSPLYGGIALLNDVNGVIQKTSSVIGGILNNLQASLSSSLALVGGIGSTQSQPQVTTVVQQELAPVIETPPLASERVSVSVSQPSQEVVNTPAVQPIVNELQVPVVSTPLVIVPPAAAEETPVPPVAPVYRGSGSVTGVSPDALAPQVEQQSQPQQEQIVLADSFATSTDDVATTTDQFIETATTTDDIGDTATATEEVIGTSTSTEPVITEPVVPPVPEIIDGPSVIINEIAWMGTKAQANDEWIELYNKTGSDIDLSGWMIESRNRRFSIPLEGVIAAHGYFLLERTASTTTDQGEHMVYMGALNNDGPDANLYLKNGTTTVDGVDFNKWPAGENSDKRSMERVSVYATSTLSANWKTYGDPDAMPYAKDAKGDDIFGTPGRKNSVSGFYTPAGNIADDTTWFKARSPYFIPAPITVAAGATLTIEPGVVVKFANGMPYGGKMDVYGVLSAQGSAAEPIVFTSFLDDDADGIDSNRDSGITSPAPGDWLNINFYNADTPSIIRYAQVRYGGQGINNNPNGWYPTYTGVLSAHGANPEISDSIVENNLAIAAYVDNAGRPKLHGNTIQNTIQPTHAGAPNVGVGIFIGMDASAEIIGNVLKNNVVGIRSESSADASLVVKDNTFESNGKNGEFVKGYANWNLENSGNEDVNKQGGFEIRIIVYDSQEKTIHADTMPYIVADTLQILEGGKLFIEPGAVMKFKTLTGITANGVLAAVGSAEMPIVFTAFADDSDGYDSNNSPASATPGAWNNVAFSGASSSNSVLDHARIAYGGQGTNTCPHAYFGGPCMTYDGAVFIDGADPMLTHTLIENSLGVAVFIDGTAKPTISDSEIRDTKEAIETPTTTIGGYGISIGPEAEPVLSGITYANNAEDVVYRE